MDDSTRWSTIPDDLDHDATSSTLRAANETHRLCSRTRDVVVEQEKRLAEMKGEKFIVNFLVEMSGTRGDETNRTAIFRQQCGIQ